MFFFIKTLVKEISVWVITGIAISLAAGILIIIGHFDWQRLIAAGLGVLLAVFVVSPATLRAKTIRAIKEAGGKETICENCQKKTFGYLDGATLCIKCGKITGKPRIVRVGSFCQFRPYEVWEIRANHSDFWKMYR